VTQLVAAKYETRWFKFQFQQDADHAGFDHIVNIGLRNGLNPKISPDRFCHTICNVSTSDISPHERSHERSSIIAAGSIKFKQDKKDCGCCITDQLKRAHKADNLQRNEIKSV
jgi:hypothetical protein